MQQFSTGGANVNFLTAEEGKQAGSWRLRRRHLRAICGAEEQVRSD